MPASGATHGQARLNIRSDRLSGLFDPVARIRGLLVDVEMNELGVVIELEDGDHILANELVAAPMPFLNLLEHAVADFADLELGKPDL